MISHQLAAMASDWSVLVCNGLLQSLHFVPAAAFLRSHPPGAYTTTRTMDQASCLLLWERHMARLFQSMRLVAKEMPALYPKEIQHSSANWETGIKYKLQSSLQVGLVRSLELKNMNDELVISVLASGNTDNAEPCPQKQSVCDLYVHISSHVVLPQVTPAHLAVMGPGRNLPLAKLSSWAKTRQILEQLRPRDATEVLLSKDGHKLLEGLLTNFFVVVNINPTKYEEGQQHSEDYLWENIEVQTAPLKEGVLPGVIRKLIIESFLERRIRFREVAPVWEDRHIWKEAFITSSLRLVQPVASVQAPSPWNANFIPEKWLQCHWERFKFEGSTKITEQIKDDIISRARMEGVSLQTLLTSST
ncbi:hypothetical protein O6H91_05G058100 [Diphasiastrum complanatum]|uniref:Uncharacterized protein n=1 Tax=Diphasiastrum complanatum TaxID=34168 RepID=A0ACC2DNM9_DIPCM|nr:hypothetical protein O6H91_05G058100 [Diphasiastrum complanatum]